MAEPDAVKGGGASGAQGRGDERLAARLAGHRIVHEIDRAILAAETVADLATRTVHSVRELIGADRVAFVRYDLARGTAARLAVAWSAGGPPETASVGPLSGVLGAPVPDPPQPLVYRRLTEAIGIVPGVSAMLDQGLTAGAFLPLLADGRLIGALILGGRDDAFLTREHVAIAREVADQLAVATLHAEAREQLERSVARLELVHVIDGAILEDDGSGGIADRVADQVRDLLGADRVSVVAYDFEREVGEVLAIAPADPPGGSFVGMTVPLEIAAPPVLRSRRESVVYPDIQAVADTLPGLRVLLNLGLAACAFVPLVAGDRLVGALIAAGRTPAFLTSDHLRVAREIGDQLAIAIDHGRSRAALAERESHLRVILDASPNGVLTVDPEGRIRFANPAAHVLFGTPPGGLAGRSVDDLVPVPMPARHADMLTGWFGDDAPAPAAHPFSTEGRRLDGTTFPVHVLLARTEAAGGPLAIVTVVDLTERTALEARLRQSERLEALGQFAGILAHDVRNYLTTISWSAELLAETLGMDHPARPDVELIQRAAREGISMTRSVLQFARPSGDAHGATDAAVHLDQTRTMLELVLGDDVRLEVDAVPDLPPAGIAATALTQVLVNLATNARDAMPDGGTFRIRIGLKVIHGNGDAGLVESRRYVRLVISDTGTGMDEATRRRAFDAFYTTKADAATMDGTGLGLSSVFLIVSQTGGTIRLDSTPGSGTTFTVDIPAV